MINQIKQALEKATSGPWLNRQAINNEYRVIEGDDQNIIVASLLRNVHDAHLIANSPEWLRHLIGEVERLEYRDRVVSLTNETLGRYVREGKEEISSLKLQVEELQKEFQKVNEDYKALIAIMDRARKLAFLVDGGDNHEL